MPKAIPIIVHKGRVWNFWSNQNPKRAKMKMMLPKLKSLTNILSSGCFEGNFLGM